MGTTRALTYIELDVVYRDIKHVHLSVYPPTGRVRISVPARTSAQTLRAFAFSKLAWIRRRQRPLQEQERDTPRRYIDRERHYLWGRRYLLTIEQRNAPIAIETDHKRIVMSVRPSTDSLARDAIMSRWYRSQIRDAAPEIIAR